MEEKLYWIEITPEKQKEFTPRVRSGYDALCPFEDHRGHKWYGPFYTVTHMTDFFKVLQPPLGWASLVVIGIKDWGTLAEGIKEHSEHSNSYYPGDEEFSIFPLAALPQARETKA